MRNDVGVSRRSIIFIVVAGDESESTLSIPESITGTLDFRDEDIMTQTEAGKWWKQRKEDCEVMVVREVK